ncbi:hypothetical protein SAMN05421659_11239 [[Clostridium] fimetarium]|uniref:Uncharacterized protein n=1 Tax=[Clostridium] fimetarium TaxID=99656 RepID=A0A1I0R5Z1_9FIRM|nr:hypothetical protein SAMN05421659_11239 [[Clostridium] fimetarium]
MKKYKIVLSKSMIFESDVRLAKYEAWKDEFCE